jgi:Uma2 family endonuclease
MREHFMADSTRLVTAAELEKYPDDDYRYELVAGRLIRMSPTGWEHGRIVGQLLAILGEYVRSRNLGRAVTEVGFKLRSDPDTVRAPDVAFVRQERLPSGKVKGFWNGPPDAAIEVTSPDDTPAEVQAKVEEYLTAGVLVVVVIDPDEETATTYRRLSPPVTVRGDDQLGLDDVIAGFSCPVRKIFE